MHLAAIEQPVGGGPYVQPTEVIQLDSPKVAPLPSDWTLGLDFLINGLSQYIEQDQRVELCHFLLRYSFIAYKEELATKTELEKELVEKANRYQALKKEMKLEMNASATKYTDQICVLKDEIERAKADLQRSNDLLERKIGNLARMRSSPRRIRD
ncbi:hypothetical protein ACOSQ2_025465 [Xanthoceras sorbifolium]